MHKYRITAFWRLRHTLSLISVKAFSTDVIIFISDVIMYFYFRLTYKLGACELRIDLYFCGTRSVMIQTLSAAHIKWKMFNLLINIFSYLHGA